MQHVSRNWKGEGAEVIEATGLSRSEIERLIDEYIFSKRDRKILKARLLDGERYEPLSERFNLSVRQTKNIVYKSEQLLYKHIKF